MMGMVVVVMVTVMVTCATVWTKSEADLATVLGRSDQGSASSAACSLAACPAGTATTSITTSIIYGRRGPCIGQRRSRSSSSAVHGTTGNHI